MYWKLNQVSVKMIIDLNPSKRKKKKKKVIVMIALHVPFAIIFVCLYWAIAVSISITTFFLIQKDKTKRENVLSGDGFKKLFGSRTAKGLNFSRSKLYLLFAAKNLTIWRLYYCVSVMYLVLTEAYSVISCLVPFGALCDIVTIIFFPSFKIHTHTH